MAHEQVAAATLVVDEAQAQLDAAARDRRVLDRLRERHATVWRANEAHKDRLQMDEVALARFGRNQDTRGDEYLSPNGRTGAAIGASSRNDGSTS
jgi:flagellar FliJ protein